MALGLGCLMSVVASCADAVPRLAGAPSTSSPAAERVVGDGAWTISPPPNDATPGIGEDAAIEAAEAELSEAHRYPVHAELVALTTDAHPVGGPLTYDHVLAWVVTVDRYPLCPEGPPQKEPPGCHPGVALVAIDAETGDWMTDLQYFK
jgi:hypothetical protein